MQALNEKMNRFRPQQPALECFPNRITNEDVLIDRHKFQSDKPMNLVKKPGFNKDGKRCRERIPASGLRRAAGLGHHNSYSWH